MIISIFWKLCIKLLYPFFKKRFYLFVRKREREKAHKQAERQAEVEREALHPRTPGS